MTITRKPQPSVPAGEPSPVDIDSLISKGGSVPSREAESGTSKRKVTSMLLRIPGEIGQRLEQALRARPVRIPRHTWILEAIVEKAGSGIKLIS
ncbi:MAG: hypothetical protein MZV65_46770 [Chromatiales bacterium]|nr:hypothetical protein [Chromatiales bacterium]